MVSASTAHIKTEGWREAQIEETRGKARNMKQIFLG